MSFWNGSTWLRDESTGKQKKFATCDAAHAAALLAYSKAKAKGEQVTDRWYLVNFDEVTALFLDPDVSYDKAGDR